jgi:hypothetical protein
MNSDLRQRMRRAVMQRLQEDGQREFETATGINIETDVDRIIACLDPSGPSGMGSGLLLARGRFNEGQIEMLMRDHGAHIEDFKGKRLIVATAPNGGDFALTFVDPGLAAFGSRSLVEHAIDLRTTGGDSALGNADLMAQVQSIESGNAWAVGRFDVLRSKANLPESIANQLPPITWFAVSSQIDTGLRGTLRAEARDPEAATNLRDVVRGFLALAKLQSGTKPEFQGILQSFELSGTGNTVAISFDIPGETFDALAALAPQLPSAPR